MKFYVKHTASHYWFCDSPDVVILATHINEVAGAIAQAEQLQAEGYLLAGLISYEAAPAFDSHQVVNEDPDFPLAVMLATRSATLVELPENHHGHLGLKPRVERQEYEDRYAELIRLIHSGDLYQANFSFRADLIGSIEGFELFCQLEQAHPVPYAAYLEFDGIEVISMSPELFLRRQGDTLWTEPMKGTVKRGLSYLQDKAQSQWLRDDAKNRAENVMIVDLMRNDLSKICQPGTVKVDSLFSAKQFPSLHQMVSTVSGELRTDVTLFDILRASFPAGSITGTPKIRAMEVIRELESEPRRAYTGSIGVLLPGGDFQLNVAIRTVITDQRGLQPRAELGIGSGVVSHSASALEWQECLLKGEFLNYRRLHSEVFETMRWQQGYHQLEKHLGRLADSCRYFRIPFNNARAKEYLEEQASGFRQAMRVRFAVSTRGEFGLRCETLKFNGWGQESLKVELQNHRVDQSSPYQYHKTDARQHYDLAFAAAKARGFDEALFLNSEEKVAEGAISNIFIRSEGEWITPPLDAGLLPGVWRGFMIEELVAKQRDISVAMLKGAERILIGNSLKGTGEVGELVLGEERICFTANLPSHAK